jgi:hypothetical protein
MMLDRRIGISVCVIVGLFAAGCGEKSDLPKTYGVTGTVTLDGKPVDGATVTFVPGEGGTPAVGTTNASGQYSLKSFGTAQGAIPGPYLVQIVKYQFASTGAAAATGDGEMPADYQNPESSGEGGGKNQLPAKYESPSQSGLKATVTEDPSKNVFDFQLEAAN